MNKLKFIFAGLALIFLSACSSTQVGLKENWIDERDMMALVNTPVSVWMQSAGRPSLVEISGDTGIYYYNFRPTMYATTIYDSSAFFKSRNKAEEVKPNLSNAVEVWGSRRNLMQIRVVNDIVVAAIVIEGPDKQTFVRDLNGDLVVDSKSGFVPNYSAEQKFNKSYSEFVKAYSSLSSSAIQTNIPATQADPSSLPAATQATPASIPAVPEPPPVVEPVEEPAPAEEVAPIAAEPEPEEATP